MTVVVDASLLVSLVANDPRAVAVRERFLGCQASGEARHSAYDAAYLTLAQELHATCWTLDGRLVRNASGLGPWFGWRRPDPIRRP